MFPFYLIRHQNLDDNEIDETTKFLHVNYGWYGSSDGYRQYSRTIDRLNGEVFNYLYLNSDIFYYTYQDEDDTTQISYYDSDLECYTQLRPNNL